MYYSAQVVTKAPIFLTNEVVYHFNPSLLILYPVVNQLRFIRKSCLDYQRGNTSAYFLENIPDMLCGHMGGFPQDTNDFTHILDACAPQSTQLICHNLVSVSTIFDISHRLLLF